MNCRKSPGLLFTFAVSIGLINCSDHHVPGGGTFEALPAKALIIANGGTGEVQVIDPTQMALVSKVSVMSGLNPHHFGKSPDGKQLLVTATSEDLSGGHGGGHGGHGGGDAATTAVYKLEIAARTLTELFVVDDIGHNAAYTRDGQTIVIGLAEKGTVSLRDASSLAETSTATGLADPLEVTPTAIGSMLVAESSSGTLAIVSLADRTVTSRLQVGATPVAAWPAAGGNYFVSAEEGMKIWRLSEVNGAIQLDDRVIDPGGMPGQVAMSPNGKEIWAAVEDRSVVAIFDAASHAKLTEVPVGIKPHGLTFDPSGSQMFVTDEVGGKVFVINTLTRAVTNEIATGGAPNGIVWIEQ